MGTKTKGIILSCTIIALTLTLAVAATRYYNSKTVSSDGYICKVPTENEILETFSPANLNGKTLTGAQVITFLKYADQTAGGKVITISNGNEEFVLKADEKEQNIKRCTNKDSLKYVNPHKTYHFIESGTGNCIIEVFER